VNKNTLASSIRELREEIARVRGKLQLTQPGLYSHDIDPQNLKILKGLLAELERVKANGWDKRQARSVAFHEARRANLEQEGLLYTLQADLQDVEVPPALTSQARTLLSSIVSSRANLDDEETSLAEKRNLFKLRLDTVQRKAGAVATSVAELVKSDEKLGKLERTIGELDDKLRSARSELQGLEDEYRKVLAKMAAIESKQRKVYLLGKDAAGLDRLNKANEWATMRKEAESDANLSQALAQLAQQAEQQKQALAASNDAQALKDAALQAVDQMREAQENVRGHTRTCTNACIPTSATTLTSE
jgi:DNA repair exonuclease SbcCD ATPase subunit